MSMKMLGPFLHMIGALLLFAGFGAEWVAIRALRRSPALGAAQQRARRSLRGQIAGAAVILASGAAMAAVLDLFQFAWINVSVVAVIVIAASAGVVIRIRGRAADLPVGRLWPVSLAIRIALTLGVLYLMVAKPGAVESLIAMTLALAVGAIAAQRTRPAIQASGDVPAGVSVRS
jgi:hypothetical protein